VRGSLADQVEVPITRRELVNAHHDRATGLR